METKDKRDNVLRWLDVCGRWIISAIFLFAAVAKLFDVHGFAAVINAYGFLPEILVVPVASVLPVIEIGLAVGLLVNRWQCTLGTAALLLCFIVLLSFAIRSGLDIDCGCFGPEDPERKAFHGLRTALVRDTVMLVPLVYSFWYQRYRISRTIAAARRVS